MQGSTLAALSLTMLVFTLYGAGVRRPFGSLPRIPDVPQRLWRAERSVQLADCIFAVYIAAMLVFLFMRMNTYVFAGTSAVMFYIGEQLSYKIRLLPSFYLSLALAVAAITLAFSGEALVAKLG